MSNANQNRNQQKKWGREEKQIDRTVVGELEMNGNRETTVK